MNKEERIRYMLHRTANSDKYDLATRVDAFLELAELDLPSIPENEKSAKQIMSARALIAEFNSVVNNWF
jgi:hypothetical protein